MNKSYFRHVRFLFILFMLFTVSVMAETDLQFQLTNPQYGISQTTNRTVLLQAENISLSGPVTLLPFRLTQITDVTGQTTFSNIYGSSISGFYHWTIPGPPQRVDGDVWIQSTNLGLITESIVDIVNGAPTYPAGTWCWSAQASDMRYSVGTNLFPVFVTVSQLIAASNGIVSQFPTLTNYLASTNFVVAATNGTFAALLTSMVNSNSANLVITTNLVNTSTNLMFNFTTNWVAIVSNNLQSQITSGAATLTQTTNIAFGVTSNYNLSYATLANVQTTNSANLGTTTNLQNASTNVLGIASALSAFVNTNQFAGYAFTTNLNTVTSNGIVAQIVAVGGISIVQASNIANFIYATNGLNYISNNQANVTIDSGSVGTNTIGGKLVILGNHVQSVNAHATGGQYSFAFGSGSYASGSYSFAQGQGAIASGLGSFAAAGGAASGQQSAAFGTSTAGPGAESFAAGASTASGAWSTSLGYGSTAANGYDFVWSDGTSYSSPTNNTFNVWAGNGINLEGGAINGNGSGLTNIPSSSIVGALSSAYYVASTNGTANYLTLQGQLIIGGHTNIIYTTNLLGIFDGGDAAANGTYLSTVTGTWTNVFNPVWQVIISSPNYFIQSNAVTHYTSTDAIHWSTVPPGATPVPTGEFGSKWGMDGVWLKGVVYSTNLTQQIAVATNGLGIPSGFMAFWSTNTIFSYLTNVINNLIYAQGIGTNGVLVMATNNVMVGGNGNISTYFNTGYAWDNAIIGGETNTINPSSSPVENTWGNVIAGSWGAQITANNSFMGGTYGGGVNGEGSGSIMGTHTTANAAVIGGRQNAANNNNTVIIAGVGGYADGTNDVAMGIYPNVTNHNVFMWSDSQGTFSAPFSSTTNNQFLIRAKNGVGINTNSAGSSALNVLGNGNFSSLSINGVGVTNGALPNLASAFGTLPSYTNLPPGVVTNGQTGLNFSNVNFFGQISGVVTNYGAIYGGIVYLSQSLGSVTPQVGNPNFPFLTAASASGACPSNGTIYVLDGQFNETVIVTNSQYWNFADNTSVNGFNLSNAPNFGIYGLGTIGVGGSINGYYTNNYSNLRIDCKNWLGYTDLSTTNATGNATVSINARDGLDGSSFYFNDTNQQTIYLNGGTITNICLYPTSSTFGSLGISQTGNKIYKLISYNPVNFAVVNLSGVATNVQVYLKCPRMVAGVSSAVRGNIVFSAPNQSWTVEDADVFYTGSFSNIVKASVASTTNSLAWINCRFNTGTNFYNGVTAGGVWVSYQGCQNVNANPLLGSTLVVLQGTDNTAVNPSWTNAMRF